MTKIGFLGNVYPKGYQISASCPTIDWKDGKASRNWKFDIKIINNDISVECTTDHYAPADLGEAYRRALDLTKAMVNTVAFANGIGFSVILDRYIAPDGAQTEIGPRDPSLAPLCTALDQQSLGSVMQMVVTDSHLFRAMDELIDAITRPHICVENCARAIEGVRHMIAPGEKTGEQWAKMRSALNLTEEYLKYITDLSKGPRHGERTRIEGESTTEITRRSWIIMNRFIEYRKRGNQDLPTSDFPLL